MEEPDGLGFGLSGFQLGLGINLFYDKNLDIDSQLHAQISGVSSRTISIDVYGGNKSTLTVTEAVYLLSYRRFFSREEGVYYGMGIGYGTNSLTYEKKDEDIGTSYEYSATGSVMLVVGEIGWQGNDGYYFHIGYQPAAYLTYSDNYDEEKIPVNSSIIVSKRDRIEVNKKWKYSKVPTQLSIGRRWFF